MPPDANLPLDGLVAILADHIDPFPTGLLVEGAARNDDRLLRLAKLEIEVIRLAGADVVRLLPVKLEIGLELAVAHLGIDLADDRREGLALTLESGFQAGNDPVDVMLIYLCLNLISPDGVDLADLRAAGDALSENHIQQSKLSVDRGLHDEVVLALADHVHIQEHVLKALLHPVNLGPPVEAVLAGALADEVIFLDRELIILLCLKVLLLGDQFVLVESLLLLVSPVEFLDISPVLQLVLAHVQLLLLHLDLRVSQNVLFLSEFRLGIQDLEVQVVVAQHKDRIPCPDLGTLLDQDGLDYSTLLRGELDCRHWLYPAADPDVVVELSPCGRADGQSVLVHPQGLVVGTGDEIDYEYSQKRSEPPRHGLLCERHSPTCFLLDDLIHDIIRFY